MGGLLDYIVSFLGQVIVIVISRPRSLTIPLALALANFINITISSPYLMTFSPNWK